MSKEIIVTVSGGFDPIHIGHLRMLQEAKKLGTHLVVIINNDNWLKTKKGFSFMPEEDRKEIIAGFSCVDRVVVTMHKKNDKDRSVVRELNAIQPHIFANGGDRFADNVPEFIFCKNNNVEMVFNVGHGGKVRSSSDLVKKAVKELQSIDK